MLSLPVRPRGDGRTHLREGPQVRPRASLKAQEESSAAQAIVEILPRSRATGPEVDDPVTVITGHPAEPAARLVGRSTGARFAILGPNDLYRGCDRTATTSQRRWHESARRPTSSSATQASGCCSEFRSPTRLRQRPARACHHRRPTRRPLKSPVGHVAQGASRPFAARTCLASGSTSPGRVGDRDGPRLN